MKKIVLYLIILISLFFSGLVQAHQPRIVYLQQADVNINSPEISQAFYDELKGASKFYFIDSKNDFKLYLNLLVPSHENPSGRYSAKVFLINGSAEEQIAELNGLISDWEEFWEPFGRDWYLKGPELTKNVSAGKYKIEVYSTNNQGKYILAVGDKEAFDILTTLNVYWQLPLLKLTFFKTSVLEFFLTPFGIAGIAILGVILILWALIYYITGVVKAYIKHSQAKTLLLVSSFPQMVDEIIKLLQKPAYDVEVGFITTASKPEENLDYMQQDLAIMKELGFNVEQIDIEGKNEHELMGLLELKDIVFVEGGNTFYLLKAMRECNFEKVIRKLLKQGIVYIGGSAGSLVAGRTIKTSLWKNPNKNTFGLRDLKGLNLVPFDIFVHYQPEYNEIIKQKMPNPEKRVKDLRILTDNQGILVQGKEVDLIGDGEAIVI